MKKRNTGLGLFFKNARKAPGRHTLSYSFVAFSQHGETEVKVASVASRRGVDKRAVRRNRARRRVREAMRRAMNATPLSVGGVVVHWVIMSNRSAISCPWEELLSEVENHWKRLVVKAEKLKAEVKSSSPLSFS